MPSGFVDYGPPFLTISHCPQQVYFAATSPCTQIVHDIRRWRPCRLLPGILPVRIRFSIPSARYIGPRKVICCLIISLIKVPSLNLLLFHTSLIPNEVVPFDTHHSPNAPRLKTIHSFRSFLIKSPVFTSVSHYWPYVCLKDSSWKLWCIILNYLARHFIHWHFDWRIVWWGPKWISKLTLRGVRLLGDDLF